MSQSITVIDSSGNRAQYTVFEKDSHGQFHWSTEHGDRGFAMSHDQAQYQARIVLKDRMAADRRSDRQATEDTYAVRAYPRWP